MKSNFLTVLKDAKILLPYEWLATVPPCEGGRFIGADDIGNNSFVLCWEEISTAEETAYEGTLTESGFTAVWNGDMGGNRYLSLKGKEADLYLTYLPRKKELRVFAEPAGSSLPLPEEYPSYETVEGYVPAIWQLPVDNKTSKANGGMSYVMPLADGSFMILDGGYPSDPEADALMAFLEEHNPLGGKPRIAGWLITHLHGDHYGCFFRFAEKYADRVTLDAMYYNFPFEGHGFWPGFGKDVVNKIHSLCATMGDVKLYERVHTGETFYLADIRIDVLLTHEDLYPVTGTNNNDSSTVFRVTAGGQRIMLLADIEARASDVLEANMPADELKSDIVQFAHHGYEGALPSLYDIIGAPTVLFPLNIYGWQRPDGSNVFERWSKVTHTRRQIMANNYVCYEAEYVKKVVVAGAGIAELKLPYTPEGERVPDYKTIHDAIAAVEEPTEEK